MKFPSLPRFAKPAIISAVLLILVLCFQNCGGKKPVTKPDQPATISPLQRLESSVGAVKNRLSNLAEGLAGLNSRVEAIEKKSVPQAAGGVAKPSKPKVEKPIGGEKPPVTSSPPSVTTEVNLAPVVEGLNGIAEAIREANLRRSSVPDPLIVETEPSEPCAGWVQNSFQYRRCRTWNQLLP